MERYASLALNHSVNERKVEGWRRATWVLGVWEECEQLVGVGEWRVGGGDLGLGVWEECEQLVGVGDP